MPWDLSDIAMFGWDVDGLHSHPSFFTLSNQYLMRNIIAESKIGVYTILIRFDYLFSFLCAFSFSFSHSTLALSERSLNSD